MMNPFKLLLTIWRVNRKRAQLLKQCPAPPPSPSPAELYQYPLEVTRWGDVGTEVLIIHGGVQGGLGGGPQTFSAQQPLATRGWRLVLPSRPGFGKSRSRGVDDMVADAAWIAAMLPAEGAHLVGHSWGGAEALLAAARAPDRVRSLTLIEPALFPLLGLSGKGPKPGSKGSLLALLLHSNSPAGYARAFIDGMSRTGQPAAEHPAVQKMRDDPEAAQRAGCTLLQGKMASAGKMRHAARVLRKSGIPVLIITGGWNAEFDAVGDVVAKKTRGNHRIVDAPNHMVQQASANAVNVVLDEFWSTSDAAAPQS